MTKTAETKSALPTTAMGGVSWTRILAGAGIVGPAVFTIVTIVAGVLRPSYSQAGGSGIPELGVGPNALLWNAGAILFGLLIIAFAFGLHRGINEGRGSRIGPALVAVSGISYAGLGLFPIAQSTLQLSRFFVLIVVATSIVAPLFIARRLGRGENWRHYRSYSLLSGAVALVVLLALSAGVSSQISQATLDAASKGIQVTPEGVLGSWAGVLQRLFFAVVWLWIEVMAFHILVTSSKSRPG